MFWTTITLAGVSDDLAYIEARKVAISMRDMGMVGTVVEVPFTTDEGFDLWLRDKKQNFSTLARAHYETPFVWLDDKDYVGNLSDLRALVKDNKRRFKKPTLLQKLYKGRA